MSNHLIQPIEIETVKYCPMYQDGRMTTGVLTSYIVTGTNYAEISTPESPWSLIVQPIGDIAAEGEISFGVACGDTVTVRYTVTDTSTSPDYYVTIAVNGDGSPYAPILYGDPPLEIVINLSDVACGNIVTLTASSSRGLDPGADDGELVLTAEIISITA